MSTGPSQRLLASLLVLGGCTGCNMAFVPSTVPSANTGWSGASGYAASRWEDIGGGTTGILSYHVGVMSTSGEGGPASLVRHLALPPGTVIPPLPPSDGFRYFFYAFGKTTTAIHVRLVRCELPSREMSVVTECKFPLRP